MRDLDFNKKIVLNAPQKVTIIKKEKKEKKNKNDGEINLVFKIIKRHKKCNV